MKGQVLAWARYAGQRAGGLQAGCRLENERLYLFLATGKYKGLHINTMVEEEYSHGRPVCVGTWSELSEEP